MVLMDATVATGAAAIMAIRVLLVSSKLHRNVTTSCKYIYTT